MKRDKCIKCKKEYHYKAMNMDEKMCWDCIDKCMDKYIETLQLENINLKIHLEIVEGILFEITKDSNPLYVYKKVQKYKEKYYGKKI